MTAPVLFALAEQPLLKVLIAREFSQDEDLAQALELVQNSTGIQQSKELAAHYAKLAVENATVLEQSKSRQTLIDLTDFVLSRIY